MWSKLPKFPKIRIHFTTLVRLRTKSTIADLYKSTEDHALRPLCHWAGDVDFLKLFRFDTFIENKRHSVQQDKPQLEIIEIIERCDVNIFSSGQMRHHML